MGYLAEAGFDAFAMDQSGYGRSPRPMMDDPCNMSEADQALVTPSALSGPCEPSYAYGLTTVQSDWDELDTVVDFIRELRGVDRVSLVGWSAGGRRTGGYAARHPEKVDKLFLYAPGYSPNGSSEAPADLPRAGVPMRLQTHETLTQGRWQENVVCQNQVDPGIRKVIWHTHHGLRCARVGVGTARGGDAGADRQPVLGLEQTVRGESQGADDDRRGGDVAVQVPAPGVARVADRRDVSGRTQRRLPCGGERRRGLRRVALY